MLVVCAFATAAYLAWMALSAVDFLYPWLYGALNIDAHIERYAPQNRYRHGFQHTTDTERIALFGQIVSAVNHDGRGLEALSYRPGPGRKPIPLLRQPEIEHLRLVAHLVTRLKHAAWVATGLLLLTAIAMRVAGARPTRVFRFGAAAVGLMGAGALIFASFDVSKSGWFDRLHEWVFPPGHQWFFYYQESLMTTLMKAPDLFGPIAVALGLLTVVFYALLLVGLRVLLVHGGQRA